MFKSDIGSNNLDPLFQLQDTPGRCLVLIILILYSSYKILALGQCFCTAKWMKLNNIHIQNGVFIASCSAYWHGSVCINQLTSLLRVDVSILISILHIQNRK